MKRGREDGHLSKEQYDHQDREFQSSFSSFQDNVCLSTLPLWIICSLILFIF
jgi:hypothetical protein